MNTGFSAFKAVFMALAGLFLFTSLAPQSVTGDFNVIRLLKSPGTTRHGWQRKGAINASRDQPHPNCPDNRHDYSDHRHDDRRGLS